MGFRDRSGGNSLAILRSAICGGPAGGEACGWAGQLCLRHLPEGGGWRWSLAFPLFTLPGGSGVAVLYVVSFSSLQTS